MRYGKITQHYPEHHVQPLMNIGDIVQTIAVEYLYELMGVPSDQVEGVSKYALRDYQGEGLVIPVTGFFNERSDMGEIPFSDNIVPVFLGYHLGWGLYDKANLEFFKKHQPIGCRDVYTKNNFERYGISAYVCGCPTIMFARRPECQGRDRVFLVDVPTELDAFIPKELCDRVERVSHIIPLKNVPLSESEYAELVGYTKTILKRYRNEARLVVTGRIHCALPCLAMGIPVIFTTSNMQEAYSFLLNMVDVYTPDRFHEINWKPPVIELEEIKTDFLSLAKKSLRAAFELKVAGGRLDSFFCAEPEVGYYQEERSKLKALFAESATEYIIWGVGALGSKVFQLMQEEFPQARLKVCCDSFSSHDFFGGEVIRPDQIPPPSDGVIILAATSYGVNESEQFLKRMGYVKGVSYNNFFVHPGIRK